MLKINSANPSAISGSYRGSIYLNQSGLACHYPGIIRRIVKSCISSFMIKPVYQSRNLLIDETTADTRRRRRPRWESRRNPPPASCHPIIAAQINPAPFCFESPREDDRTLRALRAGRPACPRGNAARRGLTRAGGRAQSHVVPFRFICFHSLSPAGIMDIVA